MGSTDPKSCGRPSTTIRLARNSDSGICARDSFAVRGSGIGLPFIDDLAGRPTLGEVELVGNLALLAVGVLARSDGITEDDARAP